MVLIGLLVAVAIVMEIFYRLNPFKKPEPSYEEWVQRIHAADWYKELWQEERYRRVLEEDPYVLAFYSGPYEAKRLLTNEGYQAGLIEYVKEKADRSDGEGGTENANNVEQHGGKSK